MSRLPPLELLEATHQFPCRYIFKIIGQGDHNWVSEIEAAVQAELSVKQAPKSMTRLSENGKHTSITLELHVQSAQEIHAVYNRLLKMHGILLLL